MNRQTHHRSAERRCTHRNGLILRQQPARRTHAYVYIRLESCSTIVPGLHRHQMISNRETDVGVDRIGIHLGYECVIDINLDRNYFVLRIGGARLDVSRRRHNQVLRGRAHSHGRIRRPGCAGTGTGRRRNRKQRKNQHRQRKTRIEESFANIGEHSRPFQLQIRIHDTPIDLAGAHKRKG